MIKVGKIRPLDEIDRRILNILTDNARTKLTVIAKTVQLSVDSTKKRIQKLEKNGVILKYTIHSEDPEVHLGVHIYVKIKNMTVERYAEFIEYMKKNTRCIDMMSVLGDYDIYIVLLGRDPQDLDRMKLEIKQKFTDLIGDWKEVLVTKIYKLEEYKF
ncbi:MAG: Lrp/AsnC family transcriptional regulator [Candidatus Aenigmatarchaeota archaeon]